LERIPRAGAECGENLPAFLLTLKSQREAESRRGERESAFVLTLEADLKSEITQRGAGFRCPAQIKADSRSPLPAAGKNSVVAIVLEKRGTRAGNGQRKYFKRKNIFLSIKYRTKIFSTFFSIFHYIHSISKRLFLRLYL
jgi:hypothetical protein